MKLSDNAFFRLCIEKQIDGNPLTESEQKRFDKICEDAESQADKQFERSQLKEV